MPMTKVNLNALSYILKEEMYDDNVKEFIDHVNSLYKDDSKEKFQKVLNELEQYGVKSKRTDDKLEKIIRDGLRSVIFDHYTNLNVNIRRKLKTKIDKFWSKFRNIKSEKNSEESKDDSDATELKNKPKTLKNNAKVGVGKGKLSKRDRKIRDILSSDESLSANKDSTLKPVKKKKIIPKNLKDESSSLNSEKLGSAETFDSNSIEFSLERQQQYNTQRYATLYTESITGAPKKTVKKVKKMKSRSKPQKKNYRADSKETPTSDTLFGARQKTTPSALRTKKVDIDLKLKKNDTVNNATSNNNTQVLKADDKKLKSVLKETKRQFRDPMEDTDAGSDIAPDSTELTNARKHINSKSKNPLPDHRRTIEEEAAFGETSKKRKSTNKTRSHQNKKDLRRDNSFPLSSIEGLSIEMFKKDRDDNLPSRRSATNNKNLNPAEVIFLKRINDLEKKINEVKHKIDVNITRVDKGKGKDDIVKLVGGKVEEKKTKKIEKKSSENNQKIQSESSTKDAKEEIKDINSNKNIYNDNKSTNITDNNKESTTKGRNDTKDDVASSKNEVKSGRTQRELAFSSPPFDEDFDFKKDGLDNNKKIPFINNEVDDVNAGSDIAPDSTELSNARKHINSKSKNPLADHRRTIQVEAAFGETSKKRKSTNKTRSFRNKKDLRRDNSFPLSSIEGLSIEMFKKDRDDNLPSRRSATNNKNLNPAEVIFLKRINDLEKKINEVKHKIDVNTTRVNKGKGKDDIVKLVDGKMEEKKTKNIEKKSSSKETENNQKIQPGSSTKDAKEEIKDINSNKNIYNDNKSTNITDNNKESTTKVRNDTKDDVASSKNEIKSGRNQRELAFSSPPFDEDFDFKKDGIDNNKKIPFINNEVGDVKYRKFYDFKGRKND
ncbi:hypothetical protein B5X24_HaOG211774 [Helicoverpa armigera]|uniref:Uncharacterized protein n=1 Tax=Helicoverpa armigera TaxID=29058 RepID=A0A2W1BEP5_HELAM|nr:hypothetical protein B5X24_HaOG211774 [Helicoverpa armigera]